MKRKAGRRAERAAGRRRQEKKVVGSQLLLHDDLLSLPAVTDTLKKHLPLLDYMTTCGRKGKLHNNHSNDQKLPVKLTCFTMCLGQKHTHTFPWSHTASFSQFPRMCCLVSICPCVCLSFAFTVLLSVAS